MQPGELALGGLGISAVVAGLMLMFKQFLPDADRRVYLATSLILAMGLAVVAWIRVLGVPMGVNGWIDMLVAGLIVGLGVGKTYDEVKHTIVADKNEG